ncbi:sigma-70 family RNA polymerase sigma factor [Siphonobacter sp. SORGH_AS_1065]|uniref:sigma-70 family RNA polymerase sigma factor n=1 Tax=Siphonobacter sp. SORGH_AS_1065 TaxID=3041795 RepID=UPI00277E314F|nr:sigma-70 family RNA polymerase sigma factor [Siphonobacter sp. SORGH_AS_1065]MDQ1089817.1 RNA polymerase sigma-70 factor (family 1) [Siphonobacter sp. SORGH_AS_1065]
MRFHTEDTSLRAASGEAFVFSSLYQHYYHSALKFCLDLIKDRAEAENIIHDVFMKMWIKRASLKAELNLKSYLFTSVKNLTLDRLKEIHKSDLLQKQFLFVEAIEMPEEEEDGSIQGLRDALDTLSEKRKQILFLNIQEKKSYQEIANDLGISKNTVKNHLIVSKKIIRDRMVWPK